MLLKLSTPNQPVNSPICDGRDLKDSTLFEYSCELTNVSEWKAKILMDDMVILKWPKRPKSCQNMVYTENVTKLSLNPKESSQVHFMRQNLLLSHLRT